MIRSRVGQEADRTRMNQELRRTRWSRFSIRLHVPPGMGVFLLAASDGEDPQPVLLVGSFLGLIPWGIVANAPRAAGSGERTSGPGRPASGGE